MSAYFADTWYFVALIKRDDRHHEVARRISASLTGATVVTSDAVLIELLNYVSETGELLRARAAEFVSRALDGDADLQVIEQDRSLFRVALELSKARGQGVQPGRLHVDVHHGKTIDHQRDH